MVLSWTVTGVYVVVATQTTSSWKLSTVTQGSCDIAPSLAPRASGTDRQSREGLGMEDRDWVHGLTRAAIVQDTQDHKC